MISFDKIVLTTVQVTYYRLDYKSILQEFIWSTDDVLPEFPRVGKFLWHWKNNILAPIHSVTLTYNNGRRSDFVNGKDIFDI